MPKDDPDYRVTVSPRGGVGRGALWKWTIFKGNKIIKSGEVKGAENKAYEAAALARASL